MVSAGSDIVIKIGGIDYSNNISSFSESGGENQYDMIRTFGGKYQQILTGKSDYEINLNFQITSTTLKTLFESTTPKTIELTLGSDMTVTYNNMLPKNLEIKTEVEGISEGDLSYTCTANNSSGTNNRVLS